MEGCIEMINFGECDDPCGDQEANKEKFDFGERSVLHAVTVEDPELVEWAGSRRWMDIGIYGYYNILRHKLQF